MQFDVAVEGDIHRLRHYQFLSRIVAHRAAWHFLFYGDKAQVVFHRRQRCGDTRWTGADDEHVVYFGWSGLFFGGDTFYGLASLAQGVAYEAHAAQLADDIDARYVGFEISLDMWDIDAALRGAKDQRDRIDRATGGTLAVADTARGVEQGWAILN